jgi:2,5-dihydroxypyridine 5,6-dioxygenase
MIGHGCYVPLKKAFWMSARFLEILPSVTDIVKRCEVKPGENVVIYSDMKQKEELVEALFAASQMGGAAPVVVLSKSAEAELMAPPKKAMDAMKGADIVFDAASLPWLYTDSTGEVLDSGARMLQVLATEEVIMKRPPTEKIIRMAQAADAVFANAKTVHITSSTGTDLRANIAGRPPGAQDGVVRTQGEWDSACTAFGAIFPHEDSHDGTLVLSPGDVILAGELNTVLSSKVTLTIKRGRITRIEGGRDAIVYEEWLKDHDGNANVGSHVTFGFDPRAKMTGDPPDAESFFGGVTLAFGASDFRGSGGKVKSNAHTDITVRHHSFAIDDKTIINDERFVHEDLK